MFIPHYDTSFITHWLMLKKIFLMDEGLCFHWSLWCSKRFWLLAGIYLSHKSILVTYFTKTTGFKMQCSSLLQIFGDFYIVEKKWFMKICIYTFKVWPWSWNDNWRGKKDRKFNEHQVSPPSVWEVFMIPPL